MMIDDITGIGKAVGEVAKQAGELAKEPVGNIVNPPTKVLGERLGGIFELIFWPVEKAQIYKVHRIEEYKRSLEEKVSAIPVEKLVEPPLNVVGPALEAAKYYIEDEILRDMFAQLIASSMNSDTANLAHPSFVEIIKQLSPLDANLLKSMVVQNSVKSLESEAVPIYTLVEFRNIKHSNCPYTFLNYISGIGVSEVTLENLIRLRLIELSSKGLDEAEFEKYPKMQSYAESINQLKKEAQYKMIYKLYSANLTNFGATFCKAVIEKNINSEE